MEVERRRISRRRAAVAAGLFLTIAAVGAANEYTPEPPRIVDCPIMGEEFTIPPNFGPIEVVARSGFIIGDATVNDGIHKAKDVQHFAVTDFFPEGDKCTLFKIDAPYGATVYVADKNTSQYDNEETVKKFKAITSGISGREPQVFIASGLK